MKRKKYEVPTMDVVEVKQQAQLLAGSVGASRDGYGVATVDTWGDDPSAPLLNDDVLFE